MYYLDLSHESIFTFKFQINSYIHVVHRACNVFMLNLTDRDSMSSHDIFLLAQIITSLQLLTVISSIQLFNDLSQVL